MWKPLPDWLVLPRWAQQAIIIAAFLILMAFIGYSIWTQD
jgi:hypothetical protein